MRTTKGLMISRSASRRRRRRDKAMSSRSYEPDPEIEPEQARADRLELPRTATTSDVVEALAVELPNMHSRVEVKVENPISNANAQRCGAFSTFDTYLITASGGENEGRRLIYKVALSGDWNAAKLVLRSDKSVACLSITKLEDTPLHLAALANQTAIVHMLVKYLDEGDLEIKNNYENTAFFTAAVSGDVEITKVMYEKNNTLPTIRNRFGISPIQEAAVLGNKKMVEYLYEITPFQDFKAEERIKILAATINTGIYDIALEILKADGSIVASCPNVIVRGCALHELAQKPFSYYQQVKNGYVKISLESPLMFPFGCACTCITPSAWKY